MENCMLIKLKGASTNEDLPVFETIIEKEWIKTTADNQYMKIPNVSGVVLNNMVFDLKFKANSEQMGDGYHCIYRDSKNWHRLNVKKTGENTGEFQYSVFGNNGVTGTIPCSLDEEHVVNFNPKSKTLTFDGTEYQIVTDATSSSTNTNCYLLADGTGTTTSSKAGAVSIGEFVSRNYTSGYPIRYAWKPYVINGEWKPTTMRNSL